MPIYTIIGYYASTGERYSDDYEGETANDAEDAAIHFFDDLVVVASFPALPRIDLCMNVERTRTTSINDLKD